MIPSFENIRGRVTIVNVAFSQMSSRKRKLNSHPDVSFRRDLAPISLTEICVLISEVDFKAIMVPEK